MTVNYTTNLGLGLPVTGTESGVWGDIVNNQITSLIETAISGTTSVSVTTVDVTLTATQGAANQARSMVITLTGASTAARNVICPAVSKIYIVRNATTGGFAHTFKTSAGSGISVPNGREMLLYCDGTNVLEGIDNFNTLAQNGNLISLAGSLTTSGANALTLTTTGSTNVTLPTTGTLATTTQLGIGATAFTASGTFTIPTGVTKVKATVVGGGAAGAANAPSGCSPSSGAGGGAGGAAIVWLTGLTPGNTITVTVGTAGNTSSIASGTQTITTVSATGGATGGAGSAGGLGASGTLNIQGGPGAAGVSRTVGNPDNGGAGGASILGGGGRGSTSTGGVGGAYGGGGAGGGYNGTTASIGGGVGATGVVFFEY